MKKERIQKTGERLKWKVEGVCLWLSEKVKGERLKKGAQFLLTLIL